MSVGPGGLSSLGPSQTIKTLPPPQEYYCVRISILGGDPNSNGGRDSNGYYRGYLEGMRSPPAAVVSGATPIKPEVRVYYDASTPLFADGTRLMAYAFQMTIGASTASDNGYMLLMPTKEAAASSFGGFETEVLNLTVSTSNVDQFTGGGFISHVGVTLGGLNTGTVTIINPGTYRMHACLTTRPLGTTPGTSDSIVLNLQINGGNAAHDDAQVIVGATPTHINLSTGNPDAYAPAVYPLHLGLVYAASGFVAGDVIRTMVVLGTVALSGGQMFFFVERIGD